MSYVSFQSGNITVTSIYGCHGDRHDDETNNNIRIAFQQLKYILKLIMAPYVCFQIFS